MCSSEGAFFSYSILFPTVSVTLANQNHLQALWLCVCGNGVCVCVCVEGRQQGLLAIINKTKTQ